MKGQLFSDHECLRKQVRNGDLPPMFLNGQFVHVVATALQRGKASVAGSSGSVGTKYIRALPFGNSRMEPTKQSIFHLPTS